MSSSPTTIQQVYEQIDKQSCEERIIFGDQDLYREWIKAQILRSKSIHAFMKHATATEFWEYTLKRDDDAEVKAILDRFIPNLTEQDFWDAVYDFDPLAPNAPQVSRLEKILHSGQLETLTLGKIYGRTTLKLIPCEGALPTTETPGFDPGLGYADTDCGAVSYADGYPAEKLAAYRNRETADMSEGIVPTIGDDEDETLRRFASLGYVIQESKYVEGAWVKTGHVLVIDMGLKRARKRHPWFVLASEWPTDGEETEDEGFYFRGSDSGENGCETLLSAEIIVLHGVLITKIFDI